MSKPVFKAVAAMAVAGLVLASPLSADTLILRNGEMVENVTIIKLGTDEIEYKIGERATAYSVKKADVLRVNYADGTSDVFKAPAPAASQLSGTANFTSGERWGTFGLNWLIPGLGSGVIMRDVTGTLTQIGLYAGAFVFLAADLEEFSVIGFGGLLLSNFVYNIVRSSTYKKPQDWASLENSGLNFAVLPDKDGNIKGYLAYSMEF